MFQIDEKKIDDVLAKSDARSPHSLEAVLEKSRSLKRLTLAEAAFLLAVRDESGVKAILDAATFVKEKVYGNRVVLFAPLYTDNHCVNRCRYCAFAADNTIVKRKRLTPDDITREAEALLRKGHMRMLMVAGEGFADEAAAVDYYVASIQAAYTALYSGYHIRRINLNCAPLSVDGFRAIKATGIGTYQLFQETYHPDTYREVHPSGPKADFQNRLSAVERAFTAGIDDLGFGVLLGLYDYRFETLALLSHIEYFERELGLGPHTISVPRIREAAGSAFSACVPHYVSDDAFKFLVAILRLSVPYTGIILSTRESPEMRNDLIHYGVSQISAESSTSPGGYDEETAGGESGSQFTTYDHRTLESVVDMLIKNGHAPSFCAACYRSGRTGKTFMQYAKPGIIKHKCSLNAMITFKEYLNDFASPAVRRDGEAFIDAMTSTLSEHDRAAFDAHCAAISRGARDLFQ